MEPCKLNVAISALTNYLYNSLSREDFVCLSIFLNELSKSMFAMTIFRNLCGKEPGSGTTNITTSTTISSSALSQRSSGGADSASTSTSGSSSSSVSDERLKNKNPQR